MTREEEKAAYEHTVFCDFLDRSGASIDRDSIKKGNANQREPDFICCYDNGEKVGFELGRLIDPKLAEVVNRWKPKNGEYIRAGDPSPQITKKKLKKEYAVEFPVELLLYKEHPIITPDDVILPTIEPLCDVDHKYSRVWFMGDTIELLYERS